MIRLPSFLPKHIFVFRTTGNRLAHFSHQPLQNAICAPLRKSIEGYLRQLVASLFPWRNLDASHLLCLARAHQENSNPLAAKEQFPHALLVGVERFGVIMAIQLAELVCAVAMSVYMPVIRTQPISHLLYYPAE